MNDLPDDPTPDGVADPHADAAETGGEVGDTVEEVAAEPDVEGQVKHQMAGAGERVHAGTEKVAAPAPVQHALDEANERLELVAKKARDRATQNPRQAVAAAAAAALVVWRLARRLRSRRSR
jgi:hypothetical protein